MSTSKKDKKKKKQKQKQLEQISSDQQKFDIISLLSSEQLDTKPNFAKFLDNYVEIISVVVSNGKIHFYPTTKYSFSKVLVRFLDKHELIYEKNVLPGHPHYYMYDDLIEIPLKQTDIQLIEMFFSFLQQFGFIDFK